MTSRHKAGCRGLGLGRLGRALWPEHTWQVPPPPAPTRGVSSNSGRADEGSEKQSFSAWQPERKLKAPSAVPPLPALLGGALGGLGGSSGLWAEVRQAEILGGSTGDFERARSF